MVGNEWIADDLTQDTFLKVRNNLDGLRDPSKIQPWIFRIARNLCLDYFRNQTVRKLDQATRNLTLIAIDPTAQARMEQHQMSQCVKDKMRLLSDQHCQVLTLSDSLELSGKEIADILEISLSNVKVRIHRARKALREILERDCNFDFDERNVMVCEPRETTASIEGHYVAATLS